MTQFDRLVNFSTLKRALRKAIEAQKNTFIEKKR
jgi:hypothetical protein